jgi:hypothetical protein
LKKAKEVKMRFYELCKEWIDLTQIKYVKETAIGVQLHFSTVNPEKYVSILGKHANVLLTVAHELKVDADED